MIRVREYHDSVRLMQVSEQVRREAGVQEAILMMGTDNNKKVLATAGLPGAEVEAAAANDLVVAIVADSEEAANRAFEKADALLIQRTSSTSNTYRSFETALGAMPNANLVLISRFA